MLLKDILLIFNMLLILIFIALVCAQSKPNVEIQSIRVDVYLDADMTLNIKEIYTLLIYNIDGYVNLSRSLAEWKEFINDSRFGFHISGEGIVRENIKIEVSQIYLQNYNSGYSDLILEYIIKPGNRSLFQVVNRSPREEIIVMNPNYLSFTRTGNNNILLTSRELLKFNFHQSYQIVKISPTPKEDGGYIWTNTVLNNPVIILKKKVSYDTLIIEGMTNLYYKINDLFKFGEMWIYSLVLLTFLILTRRVLYYDKQS